MTPHSITPTPAFELDARVDPTQARHIPTRWRYSQCVKRMWDNWVGSTGGWRSRGLQHIGGGLFQRLRRTWYPLAGSGVGAQPYRRDAELVE